MSDVFADYARYYDLLYKDKDYAGEAAYIDGIISKYSHGAVQLLNLGCGTGKHDACLVDRGYQVTGVDLSPVMLEMARRRSVPGSLEFFQGDVRTVNLSRQFDAVISLFHVMSYQTSDQDILSAFRTANRHLKPEGVFIFDFWHGEGVTQDPPAVRIKRLEDERWRFVRIAEPLLHAQKHVIDVNYQLIAMDKQSAAYTELKETHAMRYFFLPELQDCLVRAGFSLCHAGAWMSDQPLNAAWYGLIVARKKGDA